jgi:hypothetical protein
VRHRIVAGVKRVQEVRKEEGGGGGDWNRAERALHSIKCNNNTGCVKYGQ